MIDLRRSYTLCVPLFLHGLCVLSSAIAKVLMDSPELSSVDLDVARKSMDVATDLCVHPQHDFRFGFLDSLEGQDGKLSALSDSVGRQATEVEYKSVADVMKEKEEERKKGLSDAIKKTVVESVKEHKQAEKDLEKDLSETMRFTGMLAVGIFAAAYVWLQ